MGNESPKTSGALIASAQWTDRGLELAPDDSWYQGRSIYGGVQIALALRAARETTEHEGDEADLRSVHSTFIGPLAAGEPIVAKAEILRAGRSVTHVRSGLEQGGKRCFEATAIYGRARESSVRLDSDLPLAMDPNQARMIRFDAKGPFPAFLQHYEMGWAGGMVPFTGAEDPDGVIVARPAGGVTYDESEFLAITDIIPPVVLAMLKKPAPSSSMNCALELVRPEAIYGTSQWLRFDTELHDTHSGYAWQSARIYDEAGRLLAIGHQSVAVFG